MVTNNGEFLYHQVKAVLEGPTPTIEEFVQLATDFYSGTQALGSEHDVYHYIAHAE